MPEDAAPLSRDDRARLVELLEARRLSIAESMFHPPALALAGQAFLLQVLANDALDRWAALPIALAGVLASATVWVSLAQQRDREVLHSEEVSYHLTEHMHRPDLRRPELMAEQQRRAHEQVKPRCWVHPLEWLTRRMWMAVMVLFGAADIAVFATTQL